MLPVAPVTKIVVSPCLLVIYYAFYYKIVLFNISSNYCDDATIYLSKPILFEKLNPGIKTARSIIFEIPNSCWCHVYSENWT